MKIRSAGAALAREPMVHFLIAGAAIFALLGGRTPDLGERRIVVGEQAVGGLAARWIQAYRRPPSPAELDGLITDYVRDQIYYREALRLGLDQDDEVVVRRMRNKMLSLAASEAEARTPGDIELQTLIDRDPARYAPEQRLTFDQSYAGSDDAQGRAAAQAQLARLRSGERADAVTRPLPLPAHFDDTPASLIAGTFGDEFAAALRGLPTGSWQGPLASGVGLHLVRIERRTAAAAPRLQEVRQAVENDWRAEATRRAQDAAYRRMLAGYDVVIERPR